MNVAKYIGLFLLKNEQCYVTGLGTLQLLKKPGSYDGQFLHPASQEVVIVPGGNVDESLANFIANNEQISISKASNALKAFSESTRNAIQAGQKVTLPYLGKFVEDEGKVGFISDAHLSYKPEPVSAKRGVSLHHNERPTYKGSSGGFQLPKAVTNPSMMPPPTTEHPPYEDEQEEKSGINWVRILLVILILAILAGGGYYGYKRFIAPKGRNAATTSTPIPEYVEQEMPEYDESAELNNSDMVTDSSVLMNNDTASATPAKVVNQPAESSVGRQNSIPTEAQPARENTPVTTTPPKMLKLKVVINTYETKEKAYKRKKQLSAYGTSVDVIEEDTNYYFVVMPIKTTTLDKNKVLDSLRINYNPEGVFEF